MADKTTPSTPDSSATTDSTPATPGSTPATTGSSRTGSHSHAGASAAAAPPTNAVPPEPSGPPPPRRTIKFYGQNFKKDHQLFLSFIDGPTEPFIYYELPIPHINFFFSKTIPENQFEFEYVDQLAVGAGVKMSGFPSGGPITWNYISRGQKASLTMQGHKMKIGVEDDPQNPDAVEFTNQTNSSYPQTLSLGFVNAGVFTTISSDPHQTSLSFPTFVAHLRAYYTVSTEDLTHVNAIKLWDGPLLEQNDVTEIDLFEDAEGALIAAVRG